MLYAPRGVAKVLTSLRHDVWKRRENLDLAFGFELLHGQGKLVKRSMECFDEPIFADHHQALAIGLPLKIIEQSIGHTRFGLACSSSFGGV